jgi:CarD family transcriptional regulator
MFSRNEKVVYPGYGIAIIQDILQKNIAGKESTFFQLNFMHKEMTVLVPVEKISIVGLRSLCSKDYADSVLQKLSEPFLIKQRDPQLQQITWSRRQRDYQEKIQSGSLVSICQIYRELKEVETRKELSFGEKTILLQAEDLLAEEISFVLNIKYVAVKEKIRELIDAPMRVYKAQHVDSALHNHL